MGSPDFSSNFFKLRADKRRPPLQAPRPQGILRGWGYGPVLTPNADDLEFTEETYDK